MTDGNTAIPVSPITEDDMSKVREIFQRALDAIVGMSKLASEVNDLRSQVNSLTDDADRLRRSNASFEESLFQARQTRQELERKLSEAQENARNAYAARDQLKSYNDELEQDKNTLTNRLLQITKERDDAEYSALELTDKLNAAIGKVKAIHEALGIAEPKETPTAPPSSGSMVQSAPNDAPPSSNAPIADPTLPDRIYIDNWQAGALWDSDRGSYYLERLPF